MKKTAQVKLYKPFCAKFDQCDVYYRGRLVMEKAHVRTLKEIREELKELGFTHAALVNELSGTHRVTSTHEL